MYNDYLREDEKELLNKIRRTKKMVDTRKASEGKYVNVDMVRNSPTKKLVPVNEGEYVEGQFGEQFQMTVNIDGKEKIWTPGKDSLKSLQESWGMDSKNWVGKVVDLRVMKMRGKDLVIGMPNVTG